MLLRCLLPLLVASSCAALTEDQAPIVLPALQAAADRFPLITVSPAGSHRWVSLPINNTPVEADGARLDCVRFTVPPDGGDLVWCFALPRGATSWYIVPVVGTGGGFENFLRARYYEDAPYGSDTRQKPYLQSLDAAHLLPGKDYLLWFEFTNPQPVTLHLCLGFAAHRETWESHEIEVALGLKPADLDLREKRFDTRGGRILRDPAMLAQPFGSMRLNTLLHQIDGIPIAMATGSDAALPSFDALRAAYGDPDRILEHAPLIASGLRQLGDGVPDIGTAIALEPDLRTAWWDHVALTWKDAKAPAVAIAVDPRDHSLDSSRYPGTTFDLLDDWTAVLCQDGVVVGVVAAFTGSDARLVFGKPHAATWRRHEAGGWIDAELAVDPAGDGQITTWGHPGVRSYAAGLKGWRYQGEARHFYPNGKASAVFTYQEGLREGEAQWYDMDGVLSGRRRFKAGKPQGPVEREPKTVP